MTKLTLSVTQISSYIKSIFDAEEMLIGVSVFGEITNLKPSAKAIYFDVKDDNSALPCVCFDQYMMREFKFGDKVTITGKLNYYAKTGKLSFIVSNIVKFGIGDLYKQYLELKASLEKEGVFDERYKKELPKYPKRVGVVASETGAVIRDIVRVARKKNHYTDIVLYPVKVQGVGADSEIVKGIKFLDGYDVDLIIVARGGGSFEDYQPFNSEQVVRAVFECKKPLISAIGHENDWSLIDFVADVRASTPSVASEIAFFDENEYINGLVDTLKFALLKIDNRNNAEKERLENIKDRMFNGFTSSINDRKRLLDTKVLKLNASIDKILISMQNYLDKLSIRLSGANPVEIIKRGFTQTKFNGTVVKSVNDLKIGENIQTSFIDGDVLSTVLSVKEKR